MQLSKANHLQPLHCLAHKQSCTAEAESLENLDAAAATLVLVAVVADKLGWRAGRHAISVGAAVATQPRPSETNNKMLIFVGRSRVSQFKLRASNEIFNYCMTWGILAHINEDH